MLGSGPGVNQSLQLRFVLIEPPVLFVIPFPTLSRPSSIPNIRFLTSFGTISKSRVHLIYPRFQIIRGDNKLYRAQYPSLLGVKSSGIHPEPPSPEMIRNKKSHLKGLLESGMFHLLIPSENLWQKYFSIYIKKYFWSSF